MAGNGNKTAQVVSYERMLYTDAVKRNDGVFIPNDPLNKNWAQYQKWLSEGNVPKSPPVPMPSAFYDWGPTLVEVIGEEK